ncbi:ribokinase [Aeromicrobium sp. CFBP 8757]|uniref:ribokinase n=1 Tax=Aeromicrobium sp. CFBP 8757 TaxID=2775288 RepID=UPI00177F8A70|nr:ribokinase [Aeromicrobium sp. CFBP 8757]MBD8608036.1 ribokinase [Aeromicrobium sp. CFBP 8757]
MGDVVVVGSINRDEVVSVERLPGEGETIAATGRREGVGGKGANQAMAVARTGTAVSLVGAVGPGADGEALRAALADAGVDVTGVTTSPDAETGTAYVFVDAEGRNQIVVAMGANAEVVLDGSGRSRIRSADVLVVQSEVPETVVAEAVGAAADAGTRVVVNLAPYRDAPDVVAVADPLVVNEHEASELLGRTVRDVDDVADARDALLLRCRSAVVTLGAQGAVLVTADGVRHVPSPAPRRVVDTTGAGDAFVGVLAAGLARGLGLRECVEAAAAAGSLSVESPGAGSGYPSFALPDR